MTRRYNLSHSAGQPMPEDWIHLPDSVVAASDYDALAAERDALRKDAEQFMRHCYEQASVGLGVEHDCPAMYACASIIAEIGEDRGKQFDATMEQSHESK